MGFQDFMNVVRMLVYFAGGTALLILGILIMAKHKKNGLFPGLWVILCSLQAFPVFLLNLFGKIGISNDLYSGIVNVNGYYQDLLVVISIIVLFLHGKVLYKSKGLVAVIILSLAAVVLPRIINPVLTASGAGEYQGLAYVYIGYIISEFFQIACYIITMIAFIRGRYKDTVFSRLFLVPMFLMIINIIYIGVDSIVVDAALNKSLYPDGVTVVYFFLGILTLVMESVAALVMLIRRKTKPSAQVQTVE